MNDFFSDICITLLCVHIANSVMAEGARILSEALNLNDSLTELALYGDERRGRRQE